MIKLSIIIPVYNVEKYLTKCLDSILMGNVFTGQLICVNDGSTDGSGKILAEYAKNYPNVDIITQKNAGLSAARNAGLKKAKGEYVCFVDSDDYWGENVLAELMVQVEREYLDVLRFDYQNVNEQYQVYLPYKYPHHVDMEIGAVSGEAYLNKRMGYACYVTQFIIRREIVPLFTEGIHFEDVDWLPRMMLNAKRVDCTTMVVYNYLTRQGSITQTQGDKTKIRKNLDDQVSIIAKYNELRKQHPACTWLRNMQSNMVAGVLMTVAQEFYAERKDYIKKLQKWNVFPLAIADQGKTYVRRARSINAFGPRFYCLLMHLR